MTHKVFQILDEYGECKEVENSVIENLEQHDLSVLLDRAVNFTEIKKDIQEFGFRDPVVVLYDGKVLDGWIRYTIAKEIDELHLLEFHDKSQLEDPISFIMSANIHRRHLNASQRAQYVVDVNEWQTSGHHQGNGNGKTNQEMADLSQTSLTSIKNAKKVAKLGPEHVETILKGEKTACEVIREQESNEEVFVETVESQLRLQAKALAPKLAKFREMMRLIERLETESELSISEHNIFTVENAIGFLDRIK